MKNHKIGDKFVIEIDKVFEQDGEKLYRAKGMKSLVFDEYGLNILTPMSYMHYSALEDARDAGQEEAWELAQKIMLSVNHGGYSMDKIKEIFGDVAYYEVMENNTYSEAAAKVAEWEKTKEEICVGDVVNIRNVNICGVVTYVDTTDSTMIVMASNGSTIFIGKEDCTKTGRHIDVDAWLAQIGDEQK